MADQVHQNETFTQTVKVDKVLTGASIGTWQAGYLLCAEDYVHIKDGAPKIKIYRLADVISGAAICFIINLLTQNKPFEDITTVQRIILGVLLAASAFLYVLGWILAGERKSVMRDIQNHFKNAPKVRQAIKGTK